MPALCQTYLEWKAGNKLSEDEDMEAMVFEVTAIYTFSEWYLQFYRLTNVLTYAIGR